MHPGYGFLAENATFARRLEEAGITFIGPPASAIDAMGSKTRARELMQEAGVPIVPGTTDPVPDIEAARKIIDETIGYPVAVKAAGGGGGKGFRVALDESKLQDAFEGAAREGEKFFSDATVYLERYLPDPRHVEVQVLADTHGNVIHLGERDCSVQRRHQKLIEESPAPAVDEELRARIGKIATDAAAAVDYVGAGTIEGLLSERDGKPEYFFLEMNTRVQVEHCVTEMTTGIDIVKEGIRAAAGEELSIKQEDVDLRGHAIECRINAEDASKNFAPAPGSIGEYVEPSGPGVRVDSGVGAGGEISPMYDPMVAKLIVWDVDREQATKRMLRALSEYRITELKTLIPFHSALLATDQWGNAETCRDLVEDKEWLKALAFEKPAPSDDDEEPTAEQDYVVEVSGRRFDVKVIGKALAASRGQRRRARRRQGAQARRAQGRRRRRPRPRRVAAAGQHVEGPRRAGPDRRGGPDPLHHRGDEDGERDHRPEGGHGRGAPRQGGRADQQRRAHRPHRLARPPSSCPPFRLAAVSVPQTWIADLDEAETVASLLVEFRNHMGKDWPSDNAFLAVVEKLMEDGAGGVPARRAARRRAALGRRAAALPPLGLDGQRRLLARGPVRPRGRPRQRPGTGTGRARRGARLRARLPPHRARRGDRQRRRATALRRRRLRDEIRRRRPLPPAPALTGPARARLRVLARGLPWSTCADSFPPPPWWSRSPRCCWPSAAPRSPPR